MTSWFDLSTWTGKAVGASAAVAGVFGVYMLIRKGKKKQVSLPRLRALFAQLAQDMERTVVGVAQQEKMIRQRARMQGRVVGDDEMFAHCQQQFEEEMEQKEAAVYAKFKTTESAVKKAAAKYGDDEAFMKSVEKMRAYAGVFVKKEAEVPDFFTEDKMIDFMRDMMEETNQAMEACVADLATKGVTAASNPQMFEQALPALFQPRMIKVTQDLPGKHGITKEIMESAMVKFQESPRLMRVIEELTAEQKVRFEKCGYPMA